MHIKQGISNRQKLFLYLASGIFIILIYNILILNFSSSNRSDEIVRKFQKEFLHQQKVMGEKSSAITEILQTNVPSHWPSLERAVEDHDLNAQIYKGDSLYFWSSQQINNDILASFHHPIDTVILENTGWYMMKYTMLDDYCIFLFKQIKPEFSYNNSYLPQHLSSDFGSSNRLLLSPPSVKGDYQIKDAGGVPLISVTVTSGEHYNRNFIFLLFGLVVVFYLLIIFSLSNLYEFVEKKINNRILAFLFFVVDLFIIRLLDHYLEIPMVIKQSFIFQEGTDLILGWRSVGDQFLNTLIISAITYYFFKLSKDEKYRVSISNSLVYRLVVSIFYWVVPFIIFYLILQSFNSLGYSSLFGLKLNDINGYILVVNTIVLLVSLYFLLASLGNLQFHKSKAPYISIVAALILGLAAWFGTSHQQLALVTTLFAVSMLIARTLPEERQDIRIAKYILTTIIICISAAALINHVRELKRDAHQQLAVSFVSISKDPDLEQHYISVAGSLQNDPQFYKMSIDTSYPPEQVLDYVKENYFVAHHDKYDMQLTICEPGAPLELTSSGIITDCAEFFNDMISASGTAVVDSTLFLMASSPTRIYYMGKLSLDPPDDEGLPVQVYLEFFYYIIPEGLGYPELLVDDRDMNVDLTGYTYAIYENDRLIYKLGNFPYYTSYSSYAQYPKDNYYRFGSFKHYQTSIGDNKYLILSRPLTRISEQLVTFSSLFICFVIITFFAFISIYGRKKGKQLTMNFRGRLQIVFISTISFVISLLALITLFYVESNNDLNLTNQLEEKTNSVIIELNHKLNGIENLEDMDPIFLQEMLQKFSIVFFSDINLYNPSGQMLASSRPEIFNRGLISNNINPIAYEELFVKHKLFYITNEKIGNASYYSSYAPISLGTDKTVCILNLPYFAKQSEVRTDYFRMLFTFINVFVIFGIIGAFLSLFLTRILAKPLLMLQTNIGNLRIDQKNEKIVWDRSDEIGLLIEAYNKMVDKLEQSAELLKHSERESTWREVAQQIAHEIKNPLTPMKLNVQYLEKAYDEKDPDFDARLKSVSASLISQIDALDKVAEMFSDFAKSNAASFEDVDLEKVLHSSVALFKSHRWVDYRVEIIQNGKPFVVRGIEKDLLRVFNNLLKNAIQAMEEKKEGSIDIKIERISPYIKVTISDTGKGIPAHSKASIFQPYFTTKSKGTGLGLAIVRNIMAEIGGEIGFESLQSGGTSFILKFKETN